MELSFPEFAEFVRQWAGISRKKQIRPETAFEEDLGITGDDGCELLEAVEKHFDVKLASEEDGYRKTFNLSPHQFLFHSEGFSLVSSEVLTIFGAPVVVRFTVGSLYHAVREASKGTPDES
jgi:acyl carrier protein